MTEIFIQEVTQQKEYIYCAVEKIEKIKEKYMLRLELIDEGRASKTEYEKNEDEITKLKTNYLIDDLNEKIKEWQKKYNEI
jgi:hypothetical protein